MRPGGRWGALQLQWLGPPHSGALTWAFLCVRLGPALWPDLFLPCLGLCPCHAVKKAGVGCGEGMADTSGEGDHVGRAQGCLGETGPSHTGPEVWGSGPIPWPELGRHLLTLCGPHDVQWPETNTAWPPLCGGTYKASFVWAGEKTTRSLPSHPKSPRPAVPPGPEWSGSFLTSDSSLGSHTVPAQTA